MGQKFLRFRNVQYCSPDRMEVVLELGEAGRPETVRRLAVLVDPATIAYTTNKQPEAAYWIDMPAIPFERRAQGDWQPPCEMPRCPMPAMPGDRYCAKCGEIIREAQLDRQSVLASARQARLVAVPAMKTL